MVRLYLITFLMLFFIGCEKEETFNIYEEMEINKKYEEKKLSFNNNLIVGGESHQDDSLAPDFTEKSFEDRNITRSKSIKKYFKYFPNYTFEHKITIFTTLPPFTLQYIKSYSNIQARIVQIKQFKPKKKMDEKKNEFYKNQEENNEDDSLPKKFLPPRLPNLSIGVDTPNMPDF